MTRNVNFGDEVEESRHHLVTVALAGSSPVITARFPQRLGRGLGRYPIRVGSERRPIAEFSNAQQCVSPVRGVSELSRRSTVGALGFLFLTMICQAADPIPIDADSSLVLHHCHLGDVAIVTVEPVNPGPSRVGGQFSTTNTTLTLKALSMLPPGPNVLRIQTVCAGVTSAQPAVVTINVVRPVPTPRVTRLARFDVPMPPMPGGPAFPMALPRGINSEYAEQRQRR